jgi:hypothetical protein
VHPSLLCLHNSQIIMQHRLGRAAVLRFDQMGECNRDLLFLFSISGTCSVKEFASAGKACGCRRVCQFNATLSTVRVSLIGGTTCATSIRGANVFPQWNR